MTGAVCVNGGHFKQHFDSRISCRRRRQKPTSFYFCQDSPVKCIPLLQTSMASSLEAIKAKLHRFKMQQELELEGDITPSLTHDLVTHIQTRPTDTDTGHLHDLLDANVLTIPSYKGQQRFHSTHPNKANYTSGQNKDIEYGSTANGSNVYSVSAGSSLPEIQCSLTSNTAQSAIDFMGRYTGSIMENAEQTTNSYQQTGGITKSKSLVFHDGTSTRENTATATFEVEDHIARMKQIEKEGNSPLEWTAYIKFLKSIPSENNILSKPLSEAYSRAFYGILKNREHRDNEAFASIIMEYVQFKSDRNELDAVDAILDMARSQVQNYAVIVVTAAEIKMMKGDTEKALSILTKSLSKGKAQPKDLLIQAIRAAESGQVRLLSEQERKLEVPWVLAKSGYKDTTETKGCKDGSKSSYTLPDLDSAVSRSHGHGLVPFIGVDITEPPMTREPPSTSKPGLHHYNSTPEVRAGIVPRLSSSQLRSSKLKGKLGMPMRVRNPLQQHAVSLLSGETENDTELSGSFRPLPPLSASASGLFRSMSAISGYNSDLILSQEDSNVSLQPALSSKDEGNASERKQLSDTARKQYPANDHPITGEMNPSLSIITEMETPNCSASNGNKLCENVTKNSGQAVPGHSTTSFIHHFRPGLLQPEVSGMQENGIKQQVEQMDTGRRLEEKDQRASSGVVHSKGAANSEVQASTASWQGAIPVMSTPSCKNQMSQDFPVTGFQTPKPDFIENVVVNGEHYCMLKKVGRGGSAQVFMVFDSKKNVRALKVVDLEGAGKEVIDGYRNEISLLQRLQYCDSVIKMYNFEYNEQLNRLYVILEFGETDLAGFFATRAKQHCGMDPTTIKFYWKEMLRAVHALHQEGIIHSDLKPANFMLVAGNLKLIDFGIANALQQDKTSVLKDTRVGTPSYMSPEAIMAACDDGADDSFSDKENVDKNARPKYKIGKRSDVWSLGCILYNMVYGRTPFQHIKNNLGKLQAITNPSYVIKFPQVPDPHLLDVLQKCLIRDAKSRLTTEELLVHPYLTSDKDSTTKVPTDKDNEHAASNISHTPEPLRLKEQLKTHVAHGCSPGTRAVIMNLLQKLDKAGS